ncbi:MAG: hypothetical protein R2770_12540 [Acidimicrobiales bacterium]
MTTNGFAGFYLETRSYAETAAFWARLGFENVFETDHGSGQWAHPSGGPYVFISEQAEGELATHPIIDVADSAQIGTGFDYVRPFTPQHWNVTEAIVRDPDGRNVSLQAPLPAGEAAPDAEAHHAEKYGSH